MEMNMRKTSTSRLLTGRHLVALLFPAALLAPVMAQAQAPTAFTTTTVVLRAGPSVEYPHVAVVDGGAPVTLYGCLPGWRWCDVSFRNNRGWVAGGYLSAPYRGQNVPLVNFGARIGLPIIGFSFDDYWGSYYRDRPWFGHRQHWMHHPRGHHRPPHHMPHRPPQGTPQPPHGPGRPPHAPHPHPTPRSDSR
jgi:uncharacterized protein YraI